MPTTKLKNKEEIARWRKNGAFLDKPDPEEDRWEDEGGPVQESVDAPMKQGLDEYMVRT